MFEDKVGKSHIDILRTKKQAVTPVLAQMVGSNLKIGATMQRWFCVAGDTDKSIDPNRVFGNPDNAVRWRSTRNGPW